MIVRVDRKFPITQQLTTTYQNPKGSCTPNSLSNDADRLETGLAVCCDGAKAEAEPTKAARTTAAFIMVKNYSVNEVVI